MTLPTCCLAAAFATAAVTNTSAAFSTEAERTFILSLPRYPKLDMEPRFSPVGANCIQSDNVRVFSR